jgi:heme exporter protein C
MRKIMFALAFVLLLDAMWMALTVGQVEPAKRNILYAHVPTSICALLCFVVVLIAGISYLATAKPIWDWVGAAAAEVGVIFATILNLTGMVFSRAEWNTWWTPSPRLITSAILWFLYVVYLILRASVPGSPERKARVSAVFGIIAFLDVPMVYISARFLPDIHQPGFTFTSPWQTRAFMLGMVATVLLAAGLIWLKTDILRQKAKLENEPV